MPLRTKLPPDMVSRRVDTAGIGMVQDSVEFKRCDTSFRTFRMCSCEVSKGAKDGRLECFCERSSNAFPVEFQAGVTAGQIHRRRLLDSSYAPQGFAHPGAD